MGNNIFDWTKPAVLEARRDRGISRLQHHLPEVR
jgi:hypothetical protein